MRYFSSVLLLLIIPVEIYAQDDLMNLLNENAQPEIIYTTATFKSTRVMNGHSIERMPPGQLDFRISHRFGKINSGAYEFFGLDQANIHFSLEYGILKWLMVGVGRGTYEKTFDGFAKFTILRQSSGARFMPVSVSALSSVALASVKWPDPERTNYFSSRLSYVEQVLIARKINQTVSLQLAPAFVHRNLVATELDPNDLYAVGAGGRIKLTQRISFNVEYYYLLNPKSYLSQQVYDPLSVGFDIETGGHVFQLIFTNSLAMIEKGFIGETTGSWGKGDIHFGFNISRVFTLKKQP
ncbi:MAG: hypothetical protein IQL11_00315 [Bacteroidales bacterium]|nr:hypothetical protein [Bacteroidales bacterium]